MASLSASSSRSFMRLQSSCPLGLQSQKGRQNGYLLPNSLTYLSEGLGSLLTVGRDLNSHHAGLSVGCWVPSRHGFPQSK